MCIVFFAFGAGIHSDYRLIIASNRDEYLARPTHRAHPWPLDQHDGHVVVCGVDLEREERGTWLGITSHGRFAIVTNFREDVRARLALDGKAAFTDYLSRGRLVSDFLRGTMSPSEYINALRETASASATPWLGFNLVLGTLSPDACDVYYVTNRSAAPEREAASPAAGTHAFGHSLASCKLADGIWGLSNGTLVPAERLGGGDTAALSPDLMVPAWPKVRRGATRLGRLLAHSPALGEEKLVEQLWCLLNDPTRADPADLPDTGVARHIELGLSSIFVPASCTATETPADYGTRSSTIVLVRPQGDTVYLEREWTGAPPVRAPNSVLGDVDRTDVARRRVDQDANVVEWRFQITAAQQSRR
ncbi:Transport and Golgi organization protein 2 [Blastocladiella emersonii ATCC 22665]|nr:Transport and Golgi organization protein 2 [Blastocladiella emersonii ATCC 22665]